MKKQTLILMVLSLTLAMPTFAQKAMTKKEIAKKRSSRLSSILGKESEWLTLATPSPTHATMVLKRNTGDSWKICSASLHTSMV